MEKIKKTPDALLAWMAYRTIENSSGGAIVYSDIFDENIYREEMIEFILKDETISFKCLWNCRSKLDANLKLKLLNRFINNHELLAQYIKMPKLTIAEYEVAIPYIINNVPDIFQQLTPYYLNKFLEPKFKESLHMGQDMNDKFDAILVMYKLTN